MGSYAAPLWSRLRRWASPLRKGPVRLKNRLLQLLALYSPGATTIRVALHRMRGTRIGKRAFIGTAVILETERPDLVVIGNDVVVGIRSIVVAHFKEKTGVTIEDDVFVGPGVIILPGVTIGRGAVVTAGSVVTKSVPPHMVVRGNPATVVARCDLPLRRDVSFADFQRYLRPVK